MLAGATLSPSRKQQQMQGTNQYRHNNLLESLVLKRRQRERLLTQKTPNHVIRDIRRDMNMNELRMVESVTKAKRKLQRKYYQRQPTEVQSIDQSIHDKVNFDRRLKLFLHRQKKLDLLSFLDKSTQKNPEYATAVFKEPEAERLKKMVAPKWKVGSDRRLIDCTLFLSRNESPNKSTKELKESRMKMTHGPSHRYNSSN